MKEDWKECKLGEVLTIKYGKNQKEVESPNGTIPIYGTGGLMGYATKFLYDKPSILIGRKGTINKVKFIDKPFWTVDTLFYSIINEEIVSPKFLYYQLSLINFMNYNEGTTIPSLRTETLNRIEVSLPPLATQQKIATILSSLDDKIELNNKINQNLEQQAQAIFKKIFSIKIDNVTELDGKPLGQLVDIIDNRGKTPPSTQEKNQYPILDVGALNSTGRIIDYKNCTKFVEENIYNTFFRDGHPKENDILISTVGSLAQMKYFKGNKGCIAQNVVAFRSLSLSPIYLYEYLKYIKNDLLAYDIGSVQPSIKVTHIIKHLIYIPTNDELSKFDSFAKSITEQIYNNVCENERLISLRDTLLPKLMIGEIDVESVKI